MVTQAETTQVFRLPDVGEGLVEADVVTWRVAVGDTVAVNDVVCEIETAKSIVELPSPYAGEVLELLAPLHQTLRVGAPLLRIGASASDAPATGEQSPAFTETPVKRPEPPPETMVSEGTLVGYGPVAMPTQRRARRPKTRGSGPQRPGFGVPKPEGRREEGRTTREPVKGVRKAMAETMTESARTIPQVTIWKSVDLTGLAGGPLVAVARASMEALRLHPLLNSRWADEEIVRRHFVHLGIAVATERGLIVPVIRDADVLSEDGLREAIKEASATARAGRTAPADQVGGTFTITNVGPLGMEGGTPLLTPDQSAILCLGAVERRPWVVTSAGEERLAIRSVATLALTFDHRHIDGAAAAAFLAEIADRLTSSFESGGVGSAS